MHFISAKDLHGKLKKGLQKDELLIDVRMACDFKAEEIEGATHIPLATLEENLDVIKNYKHVYIYCNTGIDSAAAAKELDRLGVKNVWELKGGITQWKSHGLPYKKKKGLPIIRQVHAIAGALVFLGAVLGFVHSINWIILSGFVGIGLMVAGFTGFCGMGTVLAKLPWNK